MSGPGATPTASVVVPTYNRAERLGRLLDALEAQRGVGEFEVIVADDGSTDRTRHVVAARSRRCGYALRFVETTENTGPAGARNRGWRAAAAPVVAFIDDDVVPDEGWLEALLAGMEDYDVVCGRLRFPEQLRHLIGPFSHWGEGGDDGHFDTANIAYRRAVLESLGGFDDEAFRYRAPRRGAARRGPGRRSGGRDRARCINGEDTDLGARARAAGYGCGYRPDASAVHDVSASRWWRHVRDMRRLEGLVLLFARHPELRAEFGKDGFYRSVDKAVLLAWPAIGLGVVRPRPLRTATALAAAGGVYVWQFRRSRPRPRRVGEWLTAVPGGFVADTYAVAVMARASLRYRTFLL